MIYKFKKGSKIHIKESQKGSFTKYCNGKVTNECIQKGKNSPDPKIRKKAVFAQNSRRWKHKNGGFISGVNVLDSNPTAYKYVKKKYKMTEKKALGGNLLSGIQTGLSMVGNTVNSFNKNKQIKNQIKANNALIDAQKKENFMNAYNEALLQQQDRSSIVNQVNAYNIASNANLMEGVAELQKKNAELLGQKTQNWTNLAETNSKGMMDLINQIYGKSDSASV